MVKAVKNMGELEAVFKEAGKDNKAVLIDFFATWCGPCKMIAPKLEEMSKKYPGVIVVKVDVDEAQDIAEKYGIQAMPTFMVFKNGSKVGEMVGADVGKLEALFQNN
jgi:thioredoxin 1